MVSAAVAPRARGTCWRAGVMLNQYEPYPGRVNRYGRRPMFGNAVPPVSSTGTPLWNRRDRFSWTGCGWRDRLLTQSTVSTSPVVGSVYSRRNDRTDGFDPLRSMN